MSFMAMMNTMELRTQRGRNCNGLVRNNSTSATARPLQPVQLAPPTGAFDHSGLRRTSVDHKGSTQCRRNVAALSPMSRHLHPASVRDERRRPGPWPRSEQQSPQRTMPPPRSAAQLLANVWWAAKVRHASCDWTNHSDARPRNPKSRSPPLPPPRPAARPALRCKSLNERDSDYDGCGNSHGEKRRQR